ncbi:MAG: redoxin domain-containing protein [bacterium]|nr:redoxin domain-containing protein [bacterium]
MLTSLAPCMITLLPVIVGNSLVPDDDDKLDRKKPYIIAASLAASVIIFTVILKASTALIGVDPKVWLYISGGIVVILGISMLFPNLWAKISARLGFEHSSNKLLASANKRSGLWGQVLTGAALGPVFASCSPVYALVLATVLPINIVLGMVYIIAFALGLGLALLLIALGGQRIVKRLGWAANPYGWFRRGLAVLLIIVGLMIIGGYDKKFQTWVIETLPFDVTDIEERLIPKSESSSSSKSGGSNMTKFNVDNPYQAPEIQNIQSWINSDPQTLEKLKGKVVLIDFWTYSCINCKRTQPYLNAWHDKYNDDGLVILGIHAPEFAFEKVTKNVEEAVKEAKIKYPVGLDNDFSTWRAYDNKFWPAKYLIDKNGLVRYTHFGEGEYEETESTIQALLKEIGVNVSDKLTEESGSTKTSSGQTPETYLSYSRGERFANDDQFKGDETVEYSLKDNLSTHHWSFGGDWSIGEESSLSGDNAQLRINYSAREVYLVMSGPAGAKVSVSVDGVDKLGGSDLNEQNQVTLDSARLYTIVSTDSFMKNKQLTLTFPAGVTVNAFTFGS